MEFLNNEKAGADLIKQGGRTMKKCIQDKKETYLLKEKDFIKDFFSEFVIKIEQGNFKDFKEYEINGKFDENLFKRVVDFIGKYYLLKNKKEVEILDVVDREGVEEEMAKILKNSFNDFVTFFRIYANQIGVDL